MKTKRYWLIGGLISFLGIGTVSLILAISGFVHLGRNPFFIVAEKIASQLYTCNSFCIGKGLMYTIPVFILGTFLIGAVIGFIYGKIKNRKSI